MYVKPVPGTGFELRKVYLQRQNIILPDSCGCSCKRRIGSVLTAGFGIFLLFHHAKTK
jgi:hypothetical protein